MDYLSKTIENFLILGDFNNEQNDHEIWNFLDAYDPKKLIKAATCFKSDENRRTIYFRPINRTRYFANTFTTTTGISDCHLMVSTV